MCEKTAKTLDIKGSQAKKIDRKRAVQRRRAWKKECNTASTITVLGKWRDRGAGHMHVTVRWELQRWRTELDRHPTNRCKPSPELKTSIQAFSSRASPAKSKISRAAQRLRVTRFNVVVITGYYLSYYVIRSRCLGLYRSAQSSDSRDSALP